MLILRIRNSLTAHACIRELASVAWTGLWRCALVPYLAWSKGDNVIGVRQVAAAAAAAAAAAEATRIELQTELNAGRQRIGAAEKARLELEVRSHRTLQYLVAVGLRHLGCHHEVALQALNIQQVPLQEVL